MEFNLRYLRKNMSTAQVSVRWEVRAEDSEYFYKHHNLCVSTELGEYKLVLTEVIFIDELFL